MAKNKNFYLVVEEDDIEYASPYFSFATTPENALQQFFIFNQYSETSKRVKYKVYLLNKDNLTQLQVSLVPSRITIKRVK